MESLKAPAPCGLEGSRRHVTDRFRIAPARDATGIAARGAVGPACPASSLRCPQARVCALSCKLQLAGQSAVGLFASVSKLRAASARLQRPHRTEALGIVNRFHTSGPKAPLRPVCPLPQAHYALNALNACPVILCHRLPSETVTLCSPRPS